MKNVFSHATSHMGNAVEVSNTKMSHRNDQYMSRLSDTTRQTTRYYQLNNQQSNASKNGGGHYDVT